MAVQRLKDVDKRTVGFPREGGDDEDFSRLAGAGRWGGGCPSPVRLAAEVGRVKKYINEFLQD